MPKPNPELINYITKLTFKWPEDITFNIPEIEEMISNGMNVSSINEYGENALTVYERFFLHEPEKIRGKEKQAIELLHYLRGIIY
jgi:hypothetical protein